MSCGVPRDNGAAARVPQSFGVGAAAVGTTLSAYALARLMMNIPSGIIGDTRGRKPLMVWGPAITALGESAVTPQEARLTASMHAAQDVSVSAAWSCLFAINAIKTLNCSTSLMNWR